MITDDEIIKTLECCNYNKCFCCPLREDKNCLINSRNYAIKLIKCQKIEIERLQEYYKRYFDRERTIKELEEIIEHLEYKIAMYEKKFDSLIANGGFHED